MVAQIMVLIVAAGGAVGSVMRLYMTGLIAPLSLSSGFPFGTMTVNIIGSLLMGILTGMMARFSEDGYGSSALYMFFGTGVLGGFTTFSAFSFDAVRLVNSGQWLTAMIYVSVSVILSIAALLLGMWFIRVMTS